MRQLSSRLRNIQAVFHALGSFGSRGLNWVGRLPRQLGRMRCVLLLGKTNIHSVVVRVGLLVQESRLWM